MKHQVIVGSMGTGPHKADHVDEIAKMFAKFDGRCIYGMVVVSVADLRDTGNPSGCVEPAIMEMLDNLSALCNAAVLEHSPESETTPAVQPTPEPKG